MHAITVDRHDLRLLAELQRDGHAINATLGEKAHLSASQVSRCIQRLEESKVLLGYAALLDAGALGLGVTAFAQIVLERHDKSHAADFEKAVVLMPEVLDCFAVTGEADYVLRIVAPDLEAFSDLMMKRLVALPGVAQVKTNIALSKIEQTHEIPLDHIARPRHHGRRVSFSG
jgi:Lrp/AsnC family leucine-responsive transcriptional regulator